MVTDKNNNDVSKGKVIANLLTKAIKFTKEGTMSVNANVKDNNELVISIKDTGVGIDPEILPRLFTKFATRSILMNRQLGLHTLVYCIPPNHYHTLNANQPRSSSVTVESKSIMIILI